MAQTSNVVSNANTDWQKIATGVAHFDQEVLEIDVTSYESFHAIYFRVAIGQIDMKSMQVFYENGNKEDFAINELVKVEANSMIFDLTGEARKMKKIVLKYKPVPNSDDKEARLELWASQVKRIR